jgi:transcriptional regulator with XRE-family HTH domain
MPVAAPINRWYHSRGRVDQENHPDFYIVWENRLPKILFFWQPSRYRKIFSILERPDLTVYVGSVLCHMKTPKEFLEDLADWANRRQGRQRKLAERFGVSPQQLNDWFAGRSMPTWYTGLRIQEFLSLDDDRRRRAVREYRYIRYKPRTEEEILARERFMEKRRKSRELEQNV